MASHTSSELKNFISKMNLEGLIELVDTNRVITEERYNRISQKLKECEEELAKHVLISEQNSKIIDKFQNQLEELSNENSQLLEQKEQLKAENVQLSDDLQFAEAKFVELDQVYDQQTSDLSEKMCLLEERIAMFKNIKTIDIDQFERIKTEYNVELSKSRQLSIDLETKLKTLSDQYEKKKLALELKVDQLNELNVSFINQINNYENVERNLQNNLSAANQQIAELKNEVERLIDGRNAERAEKVRAMAKNDDLKLKLEDFKKKNKEGEELYTRLQQLTKQDTNKSEYEPSLVSSNYFTRKRSRSSDPKPLDVNTNSSDSEESTIPFYQIRKNRKISTQNLSENENQSFNSFRHPNNAEKNRKFGQNQVVPLKDPRKRRILSIGEEMQSPESTVVSSSPSPNAD